MKTRNTGWVKWVVIGVVLLALIAAWFFRPRDPLAGYDTETVENRTITTYYSFTGTLQPAEQETVAAERSGTVETLHVTEGDHVEEGDLLVTCENGREITAPRAGEVGAMLVEEGGEILPGTPVTTISDYANLEVDLSIPENNVAVINVGDPVTVRVSAVDAELSGTVTHVGYTGESVGGVVYYPATVSVENTESGGLRFGMSAEVTLERDRVTDVPSIAVASLQYDSLNQPYVYVKNSEGEAEKQPVETGVSDGTAVEITSGLSAGDVVLIPTDTFSFLDFMQ